MSQLQHGQHTWPEGHQFHIPLLNTELRRIFSVQRLLLYFFSQKYFFSLYCIHIVKILTVNI